MVLELFSSFLGFTKTLQMSKKQLLYSHTDNILSSFVQILPGETIVNITTIMHKLINGFQRCINTDDAL